MKNLYFIHNPSAWSQSDEREVQDFFSQNGYEFSIDAARGLGAGGPGWGVSVEVILQISGAIGLCEQIWKVAKFLHRKKPKKQAPERHKEIYQLIIHVDEMPVVVVNLNESEQGIKSAIDKLDSVNYSNGYKIVQNKDDWDVF